MYIVTLTVNKYKSNAVSILSAGYVSLYSLMFHWCLCIENSPLMEEIKTILSSLTWQFHATTTTKKNI